MVNTASEIIHFSSFLSRVPLKSTKPNWCSHAHLGTHLHPLLPPQGKTIQIQKLELQWNDFRMRLGKPRLSIMDDFSAKDKIKNRKPGFKASHAPPILMFIASDQT